jgi:O-antigen/teichoic acid export membrane protein
MHWFFLPLCLLMIFSDQLYPLLFRGGFEKSAQIFNIYLLLLISRMIFPQTVVMALQRNAVLFRFSMVETGANVLLSISLMHWIGIRGIAYGTVLAFLLEKLLLIVYLAKSKKIRPDAYTDLRTWMIYTLIMLASYILGVSHLS